MFLALSIASILVGPFILSYFPKNRRLDNFLFSFVLVSVGGILVLDILPELWQQIGLLLAPMLALGFFGPGLIEISFHKAADKAHKVALAIGILGLMLHSSIDGMALIDTHQNAMLPYAVILHRLVVGLSIWWLVEPIWGKKRGMLVFALVIGATIAGYFFAESLLNVDPQIASSNWLNYFQAFIAGTLLHVIIHRPHIDDDGHLHDHQHALEHDPEHNHSHGIVVKHMGYFSTGAILALALLVVIHSIH
ncbi:MAG: hypothetical protein HWE16_15970 [Gammaproteobacteria bacterium]|nr:hypothetical protein [Gammaproteobacteria bacterium]